MSEQEKEGKRAFADRDGSRRDHPRGRAFDVPKTPFFGRSFSSIPAPLSGRARIFFLPFNEPMERACGGRSAEGKGEWE